jgi:bacterioferritin B
VPDARLIEALHEQIANEFAASQQYVAIAVTYDAQTLPQLAAFFYRQAVEERNHAMMMVQYLLDSDVPVRTPGVEAPRLDFSDAVSPVALALEQERMVGDQINRLFGIAREAGDYVSEQFMQWFVKEQLEEVSTMQALLDVVERGRDNLLQVEEYLSHGTIGGGAEPAGAPATAGGAL